MSFLLGSKKRYLVRDLINHEMMKTVKNTEKTVTVPDDYQMMFKVSVSIYLNVLKY